MYLRKIAVVGSFAVSAALALPPLASADDELTPVVEIEISLLNSLFVSDAGLAGVPSSDYYTPVDGFDLIKVADAPATAPLTPFDYEIFGVNPALAGDVSDPGSYDVFNGALIEFDDAFNVELYSLLNPNADIASMPLSDLFGASPQATDAVLALGNASLAADAFLTAGWNDLLGYFGIPSM